MTCSISTYFAPAGRLDPEEIARQHAVLAADRELVSLLDAFPKPVMILGATRQILLGNRSLRTLAESLGVATMVGLRPGELLSCRHGLVTTGGCGTEEACTTCGAVEAMLESLEGRAAWRECQISRAADDGIDALDLKVWGTPFTWKGRELALLVTSDISSEKRRKVLERIFLHDILNTVSSLYSMVNLLADGVLDFEQAKDDLREVANSLVSEIYSQRQLLAAENNELTVTVVPQLVTMILETVVLPYRKSLLGTQRPIEIDADTPSIILYTDESLLVRVLGNLVKNALEATPAGKCITIGCRREGEGKVTFWCRNPGSIPRDIQLQIFKRSFSTKGEGRGVGSYSVKLLTERYLKGSVAFVCDGSDTTFTVTVPLAIG